MGKKKKLFCEISPLTYAISLKKEILKGHVKNSLSREVFAKTKQQEKLPVLIYSHGNNMIKRGPGIDPRLQENKADNIRLACSRMDGVVIRPGETFSFWGLVGKTSRKNGFSEGRVIVNGKLYRISKIYRETLDRSTGEVLHRELNWDNHSEVLFDESLVPSE